MQILLMRRRQFCARACGEMENVPVEEIARAVSGAVTSVLSKIAEEKESSSSRGVSHYPDSGDDFQPPPVKKRKQEKVKYVTFCS